MPNFSLTMYHKSDKLNPFSLQAIRWIEKKSLELQCKITTQTNQKIKKITMFISLKGKKRTYTKLDY